jgi:hypothetical protein
LGGGGGGGAGSSDLLLLRLLDVKVVVDEAALLTEGADQSAGVVEVRMLCRYMRICVRTCLRRAESFSCKENSWGDVRNLQPVLSAGSGRRSLGLEPMTRDAGVEAAASFDAWNRSALCNSSLALKAK